MWDNPEGGRGGGGIGFFAPPLFARGCEVAVSTPSHSLFLSITCRTLSGLDSAAGVTVFCAVSPAFHFARLSFCVGSADPSVWVTHEYRGPSAGAGKATAHCCIMVFLLLVGSPM